jgi:short subunit dehydrogenase-like uncharacterized protein
MAGRIVLFGATGYTGELTARELAGMGERPVLAARDGTRVRALADELGGLEWAVADVSRPESVRALVERGDVLVSCVGPFQRWGAPAVEAAIDAGAHYLDSTGETPFIRRVFEHWGPRAAAADCVLLTAKCSDERSFLVDGRGRKAISAGSSEHFGLPPSFPGLQEVDVYLGWFGAASDALRAAALGLSVATRVPLVRDALGAVVGRAVKGSTGGPDADARAASGSVVVAEATDRAGHVVGRAHLAGVNGYDFTAGMLAWGARTAAAGRLHGSGALGPVAAFGIGPLEDGARFAGIERIP